MITQSSSLRDSILNSVVDVLGSSATVRLLAGTMPASPDENITTQPSFGISNLSSIPGVVDTGVLTFNDFSSIPLASITGVVTWCRFYDSLNNALFDADCGDLGSDAVLKFDKVNIQQGGIINILSGVLT